MKDLFAAPRVAWPTLAVLAFAVAMWLAGIALGTTHAVPVPIAVALCALGAYAAFTPAHEAAHRSLARRRWINEIVGRVALLPLVGPFPAVRYLHLEHHKHTNEPDADPDHWSGRGPRWLLPLRWLTQDLHYYVVYLSRSRPRRERVEVIVTMVGFVAIVVALVATGHAREVLLFWLVPARLALGVLAFAFDYLPHRPHQVTSKQDRFAASGAIEGRLFYAALFGQSLHRVHHIYPGVPFYHYARVWRSVGAIRRRNTTTRAG